MLTKKLLMNALRWYAIILGRNLREKFGWWWGQGIEGRQDKEWANESRRKRIKDMENEEMRERDRERGRKRANGMVEG